MKSLGTLLSLVSLAAAAPSAIQRRDTSCTISAHTSTQETVTYGLAAPSVSVKGGLSISCTGDHSAAWSTQDMPNSRTISGSDTGLPGDINWTIDYGEPGISGCSAQFNGGDVIQGTTSENWDTAWSTTDSSFGCELSFGFW